MKAISLGKILPLLSICLVISLFSNYLQNKNIVYIGVYGTYLNKERVLLKFDNDIVYDKVVKSREFLDIDRGPFIINKRKIKIYFSTGKKDTTLYIFLKKYNYFAIGYSSTRHEFQFADMSDTTKFNHSKI